MRMSSGRCAAAVKPTPQTLFAAQDSRVQRPRKAKITHDPLGMFLVELVESLSTFKPLSAVDLHCCVVG